MNAVTPASTEFLGLTTSKILSRDPISSLCCSHVMSSFSISYETLADPTFYNSIGN